MKNDIFNISSIEKGCDSSTTLAYKGIKKNYKIPEIILGVSSLFFLSNTDNYFFELEDFMPGVDKIYIPNSVCFPGESNSIISPYVFEKKRMVAKAKIKKQYFISDQELLDRIDSNTLNSRIDDYSDINDFVKYNSGRFISSLEKWL